MISLSELCKMEQKTSKQVAACCVGRNVLNSRMSAPTDVQYLAQTRTCMCSCAEKSTIRILHYKICRIIYKYNAARKYRAGVKRRRHVHMLTSVMNISASSLWNDTTRHIRESDFMNELQAVYLFIFMCVWTRDLFLLKEQLHWLSSHCWWWWWWWGLTNIHSHSKLWWDGLPRVHTRCQYIQK